MTDAASGLFIGDRVVVRYFLGDATPADWRGEEREVWSQFVFLPSIDGRHAVLDCTELVTYAGQLGQKPSLDPASPLDILPGPPSKSWLTGNLPDIAHPDNLDVIHDYPTRYGSAFKLYGLMGVSLIFMQ